MSRDYEEITDRLDRAQALFFAASGELVGAVISLRKAMNTLARLIVRNQRSVHRQIADAYRPSDEEMKMIDADMRHFQETEGSDIDDRIIAAFFDALDPGPIKKIGVSLSPEEVEELKRRWAARYHGKDVNDE